MDVWREILQSSQQKGAENTTLHAWAEPVSAKLSISFSSWFLWNGHIVCSHDIPSPPHTFYKLGYIFRGNGLNCVFGSCHMNWGNGNIFWEFVFSTPLCSFDTLCTQYLSTYIWYASPHLWSFICRCSWFFDVSACARVQRYETRIRHCYPWRLEDESRLRKDPEGQEPPDPVWNGLRSHSLNRFLAPVMKPLSCLHFWCIVGGVSGWWLQSTKAPFYSTKWSKH